MARAEWNGTLLAETDSPVVVEGNVYFPAESVNRDLLQEAQLETVCGWKGTAKYFDIVVGDDVNQEAAWHYPNPKSEAAALAGHIAFWKGVQVTDAPASGDESISPGSCGI